MSWDVDEKEFYETFTEITEDRGIDEAKRWAWNSTHSVRPSISLAGVWACFAEKPNGLKLH